MKSQKDLKNLHYLFSLLSKFYIFSSWFCMINYYNTVIMKFQFSIFYSTWYLNSKTYSGELMEGWMYKIFWWWYFQIWVAWFKNISLWRDFNLKKESSLRSRRLRFLFDIYILFRIINFKPQVRKMQSCLNAIKSTSCWLKPNYFKKKHFSSSFHFT